MFSTSTSAAICNKKNQRKFFIIKVLKNINSVNLPRDLDRRFRSLEVDRRRSSPPVRLAPGGPPRRVEPRPPPIQIQLSIIILKETLKYKPNRLGRHPLTVRPRSTSTTTRRPSILRPSARLYAAESEVLTVNTTKYHRRFDHGFFFLPQSTYPHCLSYI